MQASGRRLAGEPPRGCVKSRGREIQFFDRRPNRTGNGCMSDRTFLILLILASVLALAVGIWIGLGYPGLYGRYEDTGARAPRRAPIRILLDRMGGSRRRGSGRRPGTGRWSRR